MGLSSRARWLAGRRGRHQVVEGAVGVKEERAAEVLLGKLGDAKLVAVRLLNLFAHGIDGH